VFATANNALVYPVNTKGQEAIGEANDLGLPASTDAHKRPTTSSGDLISLKDHLFSFRAVSSIEKLHARPREPQPEPQRTEANVRTVSPDWGKMARMNRRSAPQDVGPKNAKFGNLGGYWHILYLVFFERILHTHQMGGRI
jgi:hypothetical protein